MYYYLVRIGVQRHWKREEYTYCSESKLQPLTIVRVPFGTKKKIGYVTGVVKKPAFDTKEITDIYSLTLSEYTARFMQWYAQYYLLSPTEIVGQVFPNYLQKIHIHEPGTIPHAQLTLPELTTEQKRAVSEIAAHKGAVVLHGVTASGKTRLYLELILKQLEHKKSTLVLYPEISITPQLARELEKVAPVVVFHSQLTDAQRARAWSQIAQSEEPVVVLGPRSCLFLPYQNLGLVIVDEAHDGAYKQDSHPRYHGLYVAGGLARAHGAQLLLGSATPPITETEHIVSTGGKLVCIHDKAIEQNHEIHKFIVDMRDKEQFKKHPLLSDQLLQEVRQALLTGKQSLLFLNRRGTSKIVLCENQTCDWIAQCPICDLPLTYHHDLHALLCHTCGTKQAMPAQCPTCGSAISLTSFGSKAIVQEVRKLFPSARVERYDSDTEKDESFYAMYDTIRNGSVDILIGTQQIIKGLDLPNLAVVGLLNTDLSLRFPDFSSEERTFQLVTQAIGRVGRGHTNAGVILQTYSPGRTLLKHALDEDWHAFREAELTSRQEHQLPPFTHIAKVIFREKTLDKAYKNAEQYVALVQKNSRNVAIEGPIESFHARIGVHYYVQVHLKSRSRQKLLDACALATREALFDLDPVSLL